MGNYSGTQRSHYLYRIARMLQERAREFAVLESMDGGNPYVNREMLIYRWLRLTFFITDGPIS